jgi:hypothetical protein
VRATPTVTWGSWPLNRGDLYRATSDVIRGISFSGLIQRIAPFNDSQGDHFIRLFEQGGISRATPAVTRGLRFLGLIRRTAPLNRLLRLARGPFNRLLGLARGCRGPILVRNYGDVYELSKYELLKEEF